MSGGGIGGKRKSVELTSKGAKSRKSPDGSSLNQESVVPSGMESQALVRTFDKEVRPLIDLVDRLRGFGLDKDINLPAVAVIGDQSAGKSSVLEAISGVQLPRGTGIVTRCPLEMRMKHAEGIEWRGKISYTDKIGQSISKLIGNPGSVEDLVKKAQNDMTGNSKGISHDLITLEVTSPNVPDLTLIDLPGIARNAVKGQPKDIEKQIKALIRKYIERQETIILAVLQCNIDIATCEALKMAKEFDQKGGRTLGVLTKPDLLDKGAEAGVLRILNNEDFPLSKGYIMVKCRGQEAVTGGQSLQDALEGEKTFFEDHRHFSVVRADQWGIPTLSTRLTRELKKHIKLLLPSLKEEVRDKLQQTEKELSELGADPPTTHSEKRHVAYSMVSKFTQVLDNITKGNADPHYPEDGDKLYGKTRTAFHSLQMKAREYEPKIRSEALTKRLESEIAASRGREFSNYMGKFELVESIAREYVAKMKGPAIKCFDQVQNIMSRKLKILCSKYFENFPDFAEKATGVISKTGTEIQKDGRAEIERYFEMEDTVYSQDNTYDAEFRNHIAYDVNDAVVKAELSLKSYYQVATRRLCDVIPLMIQLLVFREQKSKLEFRLTEIVSDDSIMQALEEDPDLARERSDLKSRKERLIRAEEELENN